MKQHGLLSLVVRTEKTAAASLTKFKTHTFKTQPLVLAKKSCFLKIFVLLFLVLEFLILFSI